MRHTLVLAMLLAGCAHQASSRTEYKYGQDDRPYNGKPSYLQASSKTTLAPRLMCDTCTPSETQPAEQEQPVLNPSQDQERPE
jgi:hypothetical protein